MRPPHGHGGRQRLPHDADDDAGGDRQDNGIVVFAHDGINQRNEVVMPIKRSALMLRRPKA